MAGESDIERILQAGQLAKVKLYQQLLVKIRDGKDLTATELRALSILEKDIEAQTGASENPPAVVAGYQEAAEYCGFSKRTLSYHVRRGKLKQNADGTFERAELDRFLSESGRKTGEKKSLSQRKELVDLKIRQVRLLRDKLLYEALKDEYYPKKDVKAAWCKRVAEVVAGLSALRYTLPPLLVGKTRAEMEAIIDAEIFKLRTEYARDGQYCPS
jgi:hypothetical protein